MGKTADYTKRAVDNYRKNFDFVQLRLDKGEKERIEKIIAPQKMNDYIKQLVYDDLEKREENSPE